MSSIPKKWQRVTRSHPCPVCRKPDWCNVSVDSRFVACRRVEDGAWRTKSDKAGVPFYLHRLDGSAAPPSSASPSSPLSTSGVPLVRANAEVLHEVYSALLAGLSLSNADRMNLQSRGLVDAEIDVHGYRTLPTPGRARLAGELRERFGEVVLRVPGFIFRERNGRRYLTLAGAAGLLIPVRDVAGRIVTLKIRRSKSEGRYSYFSSTQYGGPGSGSPVHVPAGIKTPAEIVRATEGELKADVSFARTGLPTISMPGASSWQSCIPVLRAMGCKTVRLAFDADAKDKPAVARALSACAEAFVAEGFAIELERWSGPHNGIDDALAAGVPLEVLTGDEARNAIAEIVAEGTAGETAPAPSQLDRLDEVLSVGGAVAMYRDREIMQALAQLAETDPAEYACRRAQLQHAGVKLRDFDRALAPLRRELRAAQPPPDAAGAYRVVGGRIVHTAMTRDGPVEVVLTNWSGRIVEEIITDDGAERSVTLVIEGSLQDGTPLPRVEVAADKLGFMRWLVELWGPRAVVFAGATTHDHARVALQLLSGDVPRRTVYAHTGWREDGGRWMYLHAGGAIGADGPVHNVVVSLPDALAGYVLPEPPSGQTLADAIRASLHMLDLAPDHITVPLLGGVFRVVLGPCDSAIHLAGPTGAGKTELAALAQQHFGAGLDARHLPGSWASTGNALEGLTFAAKDALVTVDDFAPNGSTSDVARMNREADRLFRAQGNRSGRQRMRADATLRPAKPPRGMILSTGEDVPRGQSLRARVMTLEVSPGDLNWSRLTACQKDAADGRYAEALAGYARYLSPRYAAARDGLRAEVAELRGLMHAEGMHARTPAILADLAIGWRYWLKFALDVGAISQSEREVLERRVWAALREAGAGQAGHMADADHCEHFLRLLNGALASGRAHCAAPDGSRPPNAGAWGWRNPESDRSEPSGRCIGWVEGPNLFLQPDAAYAEAQEMARHQGDSLPIGARTLWRRLRERGLLASRDDDRQRNTVRRTSGGVKDRAVLHMLADCLTSSIRPSATSATSVNLPEEREIEGSRTVAADGRVDGWPVGATGASVGNAEETGENRIGGQCKQSHRREEPASNNSNAPRDTVAKTLDGNEAVQEELFTDFPDNGESGPYRDGF